MSQRQDFQEVTKAIKNNDDAKVTEILNRNMSVLQEKGSVEPKSYNYYSDRLKVMTPLQYALYCKDYDEDHCVKTIIDFMVSKKIDVRNAPAFYGDLTDCEERLKEAFEYNRPQLVLGFLQLKITPPTFIRVRKNHKTPLRWAVEKNQPQIFDLLIQRGANPDTDKGDYLGASSTADYIRKTKNSDFLARLIAYNKFEGDVSDLTAEHLAWLGEKLVGYITQPGLDVKELPRLLGRLWRFQQAIAEKDGKVLNKWLLDNKAKLSSVGNATYQTLCAAAREMSSNAFQASIQLPLFEEAAFVGKSEIAKRIYKCHRQRASLLSFFSAIKSKRKDFLQNLETSFIECGDPFSCLDKMNKIKSSAKVGVGFLDLILDKELDTRNDLLNQEINMLNHCVGSVSILEEASASSSSAIAKKNYKAHLTKLNELINPSVLGAKLNEELVSVTFAPAVVPEPSAPLLTNNPYAMWVPPYPLVYPISEVLPSAPVATNTSTSEILRSNLSVTRVMEDVKIVTANHAPVILPLPQSPTFFAPAAPVSPTPSLNAVPATPIVKAEVVTAQPAPQDLLEELEKLVVPGSVGELSQMEVPKHAVEIKPEDKTPNANVRKLAPGQ